MPCATRPQSNVCAYMLLVIPAQSLYVLSEDNPPAIQGLRSESEYIACLVAISTAPEGPNDDERDTGIRVLSCGESSELHC